MRAIDFCMLFKKKKYKELMMSGDFFSVVRFVLCLYFFLGIITAKPDEGVDQLTDAFDNAWGSVKDYAVNFGTGIAESFSGKCLKADCNYTLMFWNDSPGTVRIAIEDVKKVLGIDFDGDINHS